MPARLAFPFIYRYIAQRLDDDGRLKLDELLGDRTAPVKIAAKRKASAAAMGIEVG